MTTFENIIIQIALILLIIGMVLTVIVLVMIVIQFYREDKSEKHKKEVHNEIH